MDEQTVSEQILPHLESIKSQNEIKNYLQVRSTLSLSHSQLLNANEWDDVIGVYRPYWHQELNPNHSFNNTFPTDSPLPLNLLPLSTRKDGQLPQIQTLEVPRKLEEGKGFMRGKRGKKNWKLRLKVLVEAFIGKDKEIT